MLWKKVQQRREMLCRIALAQIDQLLIRPEKTGWQMVWRIQLRRLKKDLSLGGD
jgi:hypothetical protein